MLITNYENAEVTDGHRGANKIVRMKIIIILITMILIISNNISNDVLTVAQLFEIREDIV